MLTRGREEGDFHGAEFLDYADEGEKGVYDCNSLPFLHLPPLPGNLVMSFISVSESCDFIGQTGCKLVAV